jgi:tetratricopeptide (TPR) repeat protein
MADSSFKQELELSDAQSGKVLTKNMNNTTALSKPHPNKSKSKQGMLRGCGKILTATLTFVLLTSPLPTSIVLAQNESQKPPSTTFAQPSAKADSLLSTVAQSTKERDREVYALLKKANDEIKASQLESAQNLLNQACELDPSSYSASVHNNLGTVKQRLGELHDAAAEYQKSLAIKSHQPSVLLNLAGCNKSIPDLPQASKYYAQFLQEFPNDSRASTVQNMLVGLNRISMGDTTPASADYFDSAKKDGFYRWAKTSMPIQVFIQAGAGVEGYDTAFKNYVTDGFDQWCAATGGALSWTLVSEPTLAKIVVSWHSQQSDFRAGSEAGDTQITHRDSDHVITKARIKILTLLDGHALGSSFVHQTCVHEIGHSIGIMGHSANNCDVMFFVPRAHEVSRLSERDKATARKFYN